MQTAAIIIPTPPVISKYFNTSIVVLPRASALLPSFHCYRAPHKEQPNHLSENKFFRQQRHRHGKNQSRYNRHERDRDLHNDSSRNLTPNDRLEFLCDLRVSSPLLSARMLLNSVRCCPHALLLSQD